MLQFFTRFALTFLASFALSLSANAQNPHAEADHLVNEGLQFARSKDFTAALGKFQEAYKLYPHPDIQHNIARAQEELGQWLDAYNSYTAALQNDYKFAAQARTHLAAVEKHLQANHAYVTVRATPRQSKITITYPDGTQETRLKTPFTTWIPEGQVHFRAERSEFADAELVETLLAGAEQTVELVLQPLTNQGFLKLSVSVDDARISIAGKEVGKSPMQPLPLDEGSYSLLVEAPGYAPFRDNFTIMEDQVTSVNAKLLYLDTGSSSSSSTSVQSILGWTFVGLAVAAGATAGGVQLGLALPAQNKSLGITDPKSSYYIGENDEGYENREKMSSDWNKRALSHQNVAIGTGAAAGALALTGILLLVLDSDDETESSAKSFTPFVSPTEDGAFAGASFTF